MAKILMAMSGGVDSSVAAALLQKEGHEVIGCFMRLGNVGDEVSTNHGQPLEIKHKGCCSINDAHDARYVCAKLGITFYALDFKDDFSRIIDYFVDEYNAGRTPNPCIRCNDWLKFGRLHQYAKTIGAEYVASGHHAQVVPTQHGMELHRGADVEKDQSYVLFGASLDRLGEMLLPIGHLQKDEVRNLANEFDLPVANKPDSQDICFVPDDKYANIISQRTPGSMQQGEVLDTDGNVLGTHEGQQRYTIGQRRGLGIAMNKPMYVVAKDKDLNTVTIGGEEQLNCNVVHATKTNWLIEKPTDWISCTAQIRYNSNDAPAKAKVTKTGMEVVFESPQRGGTSGQAIVCYQGNRVISGGWIEEVS